MKALAAAGVAAVVPKRALARVRGEALDEEGLVGILYDGTRCIGCRECVRGCEAANGRTADLDAQDLTPDNWTVIQRFEDGDNKVFLKVQCMHCLDPGCVSACMLGAMQKRADGSVTWNPDLCIGCRYCEIACPFVVPRFEWSEPLPQLTKCQLCFDRRTAGQAPACVESCRRGALVFGKRRDLLAEAHRRIRVHPERYYPKVYGERDGGGTQMLYLTSRAMPFDKLGLPDLGETPVPALAEAVQHSIYKGFAAPLALFGLLGVLVHRRRKNVQEIEREEAPAMAVGGRLGNWPVAMLVMLALAGLYAVGLRFVHGLGATTNLSDGYPMGLWIAFDVVTGTALACGGYAV
ncbi:MAG: hydrogenase 2 operon protein HybA, partial [Gemmatimonadota bacterium]